MRLGTRNDNPVTTNTCRRWPILKEVTGPGRKTGRMDEAEAFAAGYAKAKLKGACTALIEVLKNKSQQEYVSPYSIAVN